MRNFLGNIGVESDYKASYTGTSRFVGNKMGDNAALFTGDIGGQAAVDMMKDMFKR